MWEGLTMKHPRPGELLIILVILAFLPGCAKQDPIPVSREKVPITTSSTLALSEFQQGMTYANKLQRMEAMDHFRRALAADPGFALAWLNLAYMSSGTRPFQAGLDSARRYAADVSEGEQLIIQAANEGFLGKNDDQERTLQKLTELYPGDETVHLTLGNYYFGLREYHKAIQAYESAVQINPELAILHNQLGYSQRALGNYGEAEKAFKHYIKLNAENPNAYDSYAELLMEMGRFKESIEFYRSSLALDPDFVSSHIGIACNHAFLGRGDSARIQLGELQSIAQTPRAKRNAIFTESMTYVCEGDLEKAVDLIHRNLQISELLGDAGLMANDLVLIGNLHLEMGHVEEANRYYEESMEIVDGSDLPQDVKVNAHTAHLANLARVAAQRGAFGEAWMYANQFETHAAQRNNPVQHRRVHQVKGIIALEEEHYMLAIEELSQASLLNPYNLFRIGLAYEGLGNTEEADSYKRQARELNVLNSMDQAIVLSRTKFLTPPA